MPSHPRRVVIFDFGGVLFKWRPQEVVDRVFDDPAVRAQLMESLFRHPDWIELDRGTLEETDAVVRCSTRTGVPQAQLAVLMEELRESLTPMPDTVALLKDLARRGIPLYGLTNMAVGTFQYLRERHEFLSMFKGIVVSGAIRMVKPEPEIFSHLSAEHGIDYAEAVFVDDLEANVVAARALGIHAILFEDCARCAAELHALLG